MEYRQFYSCCDSGTQADGAATISDVPQGKGNSGEIVLPAITCVVKKLHMYFFSHSIGENMAPQLMGARKYDPTRPLGEGEPATVLSSIFDNCKDMPLCITALQWKGKYDPKPTVSFWLLQTKWKCFS